MCSLSRVNIGYLDRTGVRRDRMQQRWSLLYVLGEA